MQSIGSPSRKVSVTLVAFPCSMVGKRAVGPSWHFNVLIIDVVQYCLLGFFLTLFGCGKHKAHSVVSFTVCYDTTHNPLRTLPECGYSTILARREGQGRTTGYTRVPFREDECLSRKNIWRTMGWWWGGRQRTWEGARFA